MDFAVIASNASAQVVAIGTMIVGAVIAFFVGRWLIGFVIRLVNTALTRRNVDATLQRYISSIIAVLLNIVLVVGILGYFGIETTSFAALLAGAGLAIGAAWSGLLANFAAGAFIIIFRPYKVGDFVTVAGITGTVEEIGLFTTTLSTPDRIQTIIGNGKISGEIIQNFTTNPYRRVELTAQIAGGVDPNAAMERLRAGLAAIPHVASDPAPEVDILEFNQYGTKLAVRPYTHNDTYWPVYFATNKLISDSFTEAGYPAPAQSIIHVAAGG